MKIILSLDKYGMDRIGWTGNILLKHMFMYQESLLILFYFYFAVTTAITNQKGNK